MHIITGNENLFETLTTTIHLYFRFFIKISQRYPKQGLGCASIARIGLQVSLDLNGNI